MVCNRCILDSTVTDIRFDENGICNYCTDYVARKHTVLKNENQLKKLFTKIGQSKKKQACIVGVSGGLDSSFLLYTSVKFGLNPIAVHIDTGWNSEVAVSNIERIVKSLNVDLKTFVIDWEEFKKIQIAFLKAGVIDLEFPTDHYYLSALYKMADEMDIQYILTGNNSASEGIMPDCWIHNKGDTMNMLDIYRKFGDGTPLRKLPTMTLFRRFYYYNIKRMELIFLLDYIDYDREEAKKIMISKCNWKEYPVKHGESVYTRFYQRYILPERFNIDIRKAHLSALICNAQITRTKALNEIRSSINSIGIATHDKDYVLKKLGLSESAFKTYMTQSIRSHSDFKSEIGIKKIYNVLSKIFGMNRFLKISNRT